VGGDKLLVYSSHEVHNNLATLVGLIRRMCVVDNAAGTNSMGEIFFTKITTYLYIISIINSVLSSLQGVGFKTENRFHHQRV